MNARATTSHNMLAAALGNVVGALLVDPGVSEIMVNPDGHVWAERLADGRYDTGKTLTAERAESVIRLLASRVGVQVSRDNPMVAAEMPCGARFQGLLPPVVTAPSFVIRKHTALVLTLDDYVEGLAMTSEQADLLRRAVSTRKNILISGGTGSGKTTLANALLQIVGQAGDRVVIIEDTRELQCAAVDRIELRAGDQASVNDLLRTSLRLRPERIIVGEVRGPEALTLLKAWNTGHPGGISTLHANHARLALRRLEQLILEGAANVSRQMIGEAVDVIVQIERCREVPAGRRVTELARVTGLDPQTNDYQFEELS